MESRRANTDDRRPPRLDVLRDAGLSAGLSAVGATTAEVLEPARSVLPRRKEAGLASTMQFTYRNPDRSTDPERVLAGARSMVVGLYDYQRKPAAHPGSTVGRVARYAHLDYYDLLREGLGAIAGVLVDAGFKARVVADSNALVDRNAAWRAGLGWYGKNSQLLAPEAGSWFVLGAVVTDALVVGDLEIEADGCGSCTACLDGCPTDALVAPGVLDARRCIAWLVQAAEPIPVSYREAVGDRLYGCDICQEVCPPNRVLERKRPLPDPEADTDDWVDIAWLLSADDEAVMERYGRWYLANRDPNVLRRTALVILGNTADGGDPEVARTLRRYLGNESESLRAHAVWAARRLGLDGLIHDMAQDPSPLVRDELSADVTSRR